MGRNIITPSSETQVSTDSYKSRTVSSADFMNKNEISIAKKVPYEGLSSADLIIKNRKTISSAKIISNKVAPVEKNVTPELNQNRLETKNRIRKMLVFLITNFGMLLLVLGYIFIGALLFQTLEQHQEIQNCEIGKGNEQEMLSTYTQAIFNYVYFNTTTDIIHLNGTLDGPDIYNPKIDNYILEIRSKVIDNFANYKYYGQENCEASSLWQMQSAILFAVTIVTTIGYGHIYPTTWQGQIVIICYAIIGIPLFLMTTAKISIMLANIFAFLYKYVVLFPCNCYSNCKRSSRKTSNKKTEVEQPIDYWDGSTTPNSDTRIIENDENDEYEEEETTKVPLFVILAFFFGFLMLGGYLFNQLENWNLITGLYFSYVSLSTMGFGDYVPGITELLSGNINTAATNLLVAVIYLFIGISVLGMCFNLMNSTIVDKVSSISEALKDKTTNENSSSETKLENSVTKNLESNQNLEKSKETNC